MSEVGSAFVSILPSMKGFGSKLQSGVAPEVDKAGGSVGKRFGSKIGSAMKVGLLAGGVAVGAFVKSAIGAGSDAQQSLGATETVFGNFADKVVSTSDKAAQKYGLSANVYRENANLIGSLFKNQGVATDQLAGKTKDMIGVGADLAATFGGTTTDAVEALGSAFKGEFDSLEKYGVSIKQSNVNAILAANGQDKLTGAALKAAQQQAVTKLIMDQSKDSLGAFGKESNTLAGQQQRLGASFDNIKATVGGALLPVLTQLAGFVNSTVLPAVTGFIDGMREGTGVGGAVAAVFQTVAGVLQGVYGFVKANLSVIVPLFAGLATGVAVVKTITAVTKAWAVIQGIMNAVLAANPIGIVVVALAGLVAALVVTYKRSETFRNIVNGVWNAIKTTVTTVVNAVKSVVTATWNAIQAATSAAWNTVKNTVLVPLRLILAAVQGDTGKMKSIISDAWAFVKSVTTAAWNAVKTVVSNGIDGAVGLVKSLPGKAVSALGGLGSLLYNAGASLIQGLINGIMSKIAAVGDAVGNVAGKIKGFFPGSPVKEGPLTSWNNGGAGKRLALSLADGLDAGAPLVTHASNRLAGLVSAPSVAGPRLSYSAVAPGSEGATADEVRALRGDVQRLVRDYTTAMRKG